MENKRGLVLGGGGSRGSYEVGVCLALKELGYSFDVVTGVSIGALIGAIYVQDDVEVLEGWIQSFQQEKLSNNLFVYPNQYRTKPLHANGFDQFMEMFLKDGPNITGLQNQYKAIFQYDKFKNSPIEFGTLSYNLNQNKLVAFTKEQMNANNVIDLLFSSTAYFPAYQFVKIDGEYYADGGYEQTLPVKLCVDLGAKDLVVVSLLEPDDPDPMITSEHCLIRPLLKLHSVLDFEGKDLTPQMQEGYLETLKYLNKAPGYLYTFYDEDWKYMLRLEKACLSYLVHDGQIGLLTKMDSMLEDVYKFFFHYVPCPMKNAYSEQYIIGRLLEIIGLICQIPLDRQYHFKDFIRLILMHLEHFNEDPNKQPYPQIYDQMDIKGVQDFIVFFHSALISFHGKLPPEFEGIKQKFIPMYLIANVWRMISHFRTILDL